MAATEQSIPELDRKGLREFGLVTGGIVAGLFGLFFPWLLERGIPVWPWALFGVLVILGLAAPMSLRPVYRVWMRFGLIMNRITTPLLMGLVFYLVVTPFGVFRRISGNDTLARKFDRNAPSYRVKSEKPESGSLKRPY